MQTYHFDCRGSTIAVTDANGNITDTFAYDTYGKQIARTGTSAVIFGFNGRDGVVTDKNGLLYMRARYYSPDMRRFVNADIIPGKLSNAVTLNRYAYANGNPVSNIDPFGLSTYSDEEIAEDLLYISLGDMTEEEFIKKHGVSPKDINNKSHGTTQKRPPNFSLNEDTQTDYVNKEEYIAKESTKAPVKKEKEKTPVMIWVENNIVRPLANSIYEVVWWCEDTGEWLNKHASNKDGSYALHDNQRFNKNTPFHEQIFAFTPSGPSFSLKDGNVGLGSLSVDAVTGGWEGKYANLSLLDFGHAEISAEMSDGQVSVGALASIWSPSFAFTVFGVTIEIGAEVGAIGAGIDIGKKGFKATGAYAFGASITVSW